MRLVTKFTLIGVVTQVRSCFVSQHRNMSARGVQFNSKHLRKGDPLPPYTGKLRLYNMRYCPYAQRTVLALNAKNIDYEIVNINLYEKPEWLTLKSKFGKVPSLEVKEGVCIYESLVTVEYLDEVYPERPLLSKDPVQRAYDKIIVEASSAVHALLFKTLKAPESITEDNVASYSKALSFLQDQLTARGTKFFGGSQPGYVDYMTWPWFERVEILSKNDERLKIDGNKFKRLIDWLVELKKDPVVEEYLIPENILVEFCNSYKNGEPNYEFMTQN